MVPHEVEVKVENECLLHSHSTLSLVFQRSSETTVSRPQYAPLSDNRARNDHSEVRVFLSLLHCINHVVHALFCPAFALSFAWCDLGQGC